MIIPRSVLLRIKYGSDKIIKKITIHILFPVIFFRKSWRLSDIEQKADDNIVYARCVLYAWVYRQTLRICSTYCFSTITMVARKRLNVTLYVHCASCPLGCDGAYSDINLSLFRRNMVLHIHCRGQTRLYIFLPKLWKISTWLYTASRLRK